MRRFTLAFFALASSLFSTEMWGQTDVTDKYLKNPSFEENDISTMTKDNTRGAYNVGNALTGWTVTGSYGVSDIMTATATATDNNLGVPGNPSNGKQMYYIRNAWKDATASVKQTITLPAAKYRMTVDSKSAHAGTSSSGRMVAAGENTVISMNQGSIPTTWNTISVEFTLTQEQQVALGFEFTWVNSAGASFLLDNVRLYDITDEVVQPDPKETDVASPTEGVIDNTFVNEEEMMTDLLRMLAKFATYLSNDYQACSAPNSIGEQCGCFKGENTMASDERGVRTNADLSMICAFLVKYAKPAGIELPTGVTWERIEDIAMKSLVFAYSTHKANKLKVCSGGDYWGSTSGSDHVWESSLWAMSVAYSAYFQWDKLTETQRGYIYALLKAECNYELNRTIPTGYVGDTKAEENGWEADVLAAALGLFPDDPLAPQWFERMCLFAANSYSHASDANNSNIVDPSNNNIKWSDLYKGNNLYSDWTLQNHNLFHTSYQNVVMQELGEAALALKMFQGSTEKWRSNALQHGNQEVMDNVLNWLALADGELAMPNGNDWSLFLYDQITSYSTQACFQRDPNALLLENLAYKQIKARQTTTTDGSWLLRPDVGARRMGVEAHRVMMTYLMHKMMPTADLQPTAWDDFRNAHSKAMLFPCQNVVRGYTPSRFTCFSWSTGLKSYTGYFAADKADKNKMVVPYRANNSGNITGWYEVSGKGTNATPIVSGIYQMEGDAWVMNGELSVNDDALNNRFALYSTPGNAFIYLDHVQANTGCTITAEKGGLLAISTDELTKLQRTIYYADGDNITWKQRDGSSQFTFQSDWVNIDNELAVVGPGDKKMAFGDRGVNNSIYTSKLYPMYSNMSRTVKSGDVVDARHLVYFCNMNAEETQTIASRVKGLKDIVPEGWNGVMASDITGAQYILISNFRGATHATIDGITTKDLGAPVFKTETAIEDSKAKIDLTLQENNSLGTQLKLFVEGSKVKAILEDHNTAYITATEATTITVNGMPGNSHRLSKEVNLKAGETVKVVLTDEAITVKQSAPLEQKLTAGTDMTHYIVNPRFEGNTRAGWEMKKADQNEATNYCEQEFWNNSSFSLKQSIKGLPAGKYRLTCQGFYRAGSRTAAATAHANGNEALNATLYAQSVDNDKVSAPLQSIFDEAGKMGNLGESTSEGYVPNTMEQAWQYFSTGLYADNAVELTVGKGQDVEIGIEKSTKINEDWSIFTNFRLRYLGLVGDVNNDNQISVADVTALVNIILGRDNAEPHLYNHATADVNGDSTVSVADVTALVNLILGQ